MAVFFFDIRYMLGKGVMEDPHNDPLFFFPEQDISGNLGGKPIQFTLGSELIEQRTKKQST